MDQESKRGVARRIALIIQTLAEGSKSKFCTDTGIDRRLVNHALNAERQTLSVNSAIRIKRTYRVTLDYIYCADLDGLPRSLLHAHEEMPVEKVEALAEKLRSER